MIKYTNIYKTISKTKTDHYIQVTGIKNIHITDIYIYTYPVY